MRVRLHGVLPRGEADRASSLPSWLTRPALFEQGDPDDSGTGGGGGPDDPPDDGDPDDDPETDPPDGGDPDDPAELKKLLEAERAKVKRANRRLAARKKPATKPDDKPDDDATKAATERAEAAERRAVRAAARAELLAAGADPDLVDLPLSRLPRPDAIEWDEDEDSPVLEDWVEDMQERYPKVFRKPSAGGSANGRRVGGVDQGAGGAPPPKRELTYEQKLMASAGMRARRRP